MSTQRKQRFLSASPFQIVLFIFYLFFILICFFSQVTTLKNKQECYNIELSPEEGKIKELTG